MNVINKDFKGFYSDKRSTEKCVDIQAHRKRFQPKPVVFRDNFESYSVGAAPTAKDERFEWAPNFCGRVVASKRFGGTRALGLLYEMEDEKLNEQWMSFPATFSAWLGFDLYFPMDFIWGSNGQHSLLRFWSNRAGNSPELFEGAPIETGFSLWATGSQAAAIDMSCDNGQGRVWSESDNGRRPPALIVPKDMGKVIRIVVGVERNPAEKTIRGRIWKNGKKILDSLFNGSAVKADSLWEPRSGSAAERHVTDYSMTAGSMGGENDTEAVQSCILEIGNFQFGGRNHFGVE